MTWILLSLLAFAVAATVLGLLRGGGGPEATRACLRCHGTGRVRRGAAVIPTRCPMCGGRGRRPRNEGAWS